MLNMIFPGNDIRNPNYNPNIKMEKNEFKLPILKNKY